MQLFGINTPFAFSQRTASLPDTPRRGPGAVAACPTCRVPRALPPASALRCSLPTLVAQGSALYRRRTSLKRPRRSRKFEGGKQAPLYVCRWENHQESKTIADADALPCLAPRGRSGCVVCASGRAINNQVASCDFACRATPCARTHGRVPHALNAVKTGGHGAARCAAHAAARCGWSAHDPPRVSVAVYMYLWSKPVCGRGEPGRER